MDEPVYRRLCMTSVCGAILIPVTMALVSGHATRQRTEAALVDATATPTTAVEAGGNGSRPPPSDPTTNP